jgi:hypothetical protein
MKGKKLSKKLTLSKTTVSSLQDNELNTVKGGIPNTYMVVSYCMICPPDWTGPNWC